MEFAVIFLVLTVIGAQADYTYTINAKRSSQTTPSGTDTIDMDPRLVPSEPVTYTVTIDKDNPIIVTYAVDDASLDYEASDDPKKVLNTCVDPDQGTWDYPIVKIVQLNLFPDGQCPVKAGTYDIGLTTGPITFTLPEKLKCGTYTAVVELTRAGKMVLLADYDISLEGDCKKR